MANAATFRYPSFSKRIVALVGGFGSGKTEVSVNLAKYLAHANSEPVTLVDLDLVNPYFRTREAIAEMEALGVRVVAPQGGQYYADLPILLPEIKGLLETHEGMLILDVGGDAQGCRALGSLSGEFPPGQYEMLMILNSRRPQTADVAGSIATMNRIAGSSRLPFTGLVSNTHMIDETDAAILLEGYDLARAVSGESGLPLFFVSAKRAVLNTMDTSVFACAILPLTRSMLKPWERKEETSGS
ncbi:MAG: cobalamin biosynthesis protein CbiA [candidate division Zixibacteria bacterium]|nr:cobalamin biosynthesis protein CbiA [candidate division Zixibacteria bacterium]